MRYPFFLSIALILFFCFSVSAQEIPFPNGSFETGDFTEWNILNPLGMTINMDNGSQIETCVNGSPPGTEVLGVDWSVDSNPFSFKDGFYYANAAQKPFVSGGNKKSCGWIEPEGNFFDGDYIFTFDYNIGVGSVTYVRLYALLDGNAVAGSGSNCFLSPSVGSVGTFNCDTSNLSAPSFGGRPEGYEISFLVLCSGTVPGCRDFDFLFDNFNYQQNPSLVNNVLEEGDPFGIDLNFSLTNQVVLDTNLMNVTDATCTLNWDGSNFSMPYNSSISSYEFTVIESIPKTVNYEVGCSHPGYTSDQNITGSVTFLPDLSAGGIIVTDLNNVSHNIQPTRVDFFPTNNSNEIVYSIENQIGFTLDVPQYIYNSLVDGRQYFVYTATQSQYDAGVWVFNDTLTFGDTFSNPIQKIWDETNNRYVYSFTDILGNNQKKYYRLTYRNPYKNFQIINGSNEWLQLLTSNVLDQNRVSVDSYQISVFSNIQNTFIQPVPDVFEDVTEAFELQFTAWSDQSNVELFAGQTVFDDRTTPNSVILTTEPKRYSFPINPFDFDSQLYMETDYNAPATVFMYDYAIVPKGYFTKRMEIFKEDGSFLDLILLNGVSTQFLREGKNFRTSTQAYDREGELQTLKVEAFFDQTGDDVNKVTSQVENLSTGPENLFTFDQPFNGIIDLNGNAVNPTTLRDVIIKATLIDSSGVEVAVQTQTKKFVQFPYFGGDFSINFFPTEKRKGKKPSGVILIQTIDISALEGFDIRIYDSNSSLSSPDYQSRIYKGTDFNCISSDCSLQLTIEDFLYEDANIAHFVVTALLNTEYFSLNNPLIQVDRIILLSQIDLETAKIHQQIERLDNTYRPDEEIPLVLILESSEADSLENSLNVYLTLQNCDASSGGNCVDQTTRFYPTGFLYDNKYNFNFYFFRHFYLLDDGSLLPDGNHIGFRASLTDNTGVLQTQTPVLANKCFNGDNGPLGWATGLVSYLIDLLSNVSCNTPQEKIVSTTVNPGQEIRLEIDNNRTVTDPSQELFMCVNLDTNNVLNKPLEAKLVCAVWYEVAESPIDNFRLRLTNNFSDVSKEGNSKQYIEVNVPYEVIAYNDLLLLQEELKTTSNTSIDTVGEFFFESFRVLARDAFFTNILNDLDTFLLGDGIVTNVGADLNFNQAFSPTTIGGVVFYRLNGFPIINANDYRNNSAFDDNFEQLDKSQFIEFLNANNIDYPNDGAKLDVFVSGYGSAVSLVDPDGVIVINETPSNQSVNQQNVDQNGNQLNYQFIPSTVLLNVSHTMFWKNFSENETLSLVIKITLLIRDNLLNAALDFSDDLLNDPGSAIANLFWSNLLLIAIVIGLLIAIGVMVNSFGNGGND